MVIATTIAKPGVLTTHSRIISCQKSLFSEYIGVFMPPISHPPKSSKLKQSQARRVQFTIASPNAGLYVMLE